MTKTALDAVNSLVDLVDGVTCYLGRWRIVKFRLQKLASQLQNLSDHPQRQNCDGEIMECIVATISDTTSLASRCMSGHQIIEGKLQMQSKLDALAASLSTHIGDCDLLLKNRDGIGMECHHHMNTGILNREILRWSVRDLLTRIQIRGGDPRSKQVALESLVDLMNREESDAILVASQGGIPILVQLLDPSHPFKSREMAAAGIQILSRAGGGGACEPDLVAAGAIPPLVRMLQSGTPPAREYAAAALSHLSSHSPENAHAMAALGAITPCISLCGVATPGGAWAAAGCIRNLSVVDPKAAAAAIPALVALMRSGTPATQECVVAALHNLACSDSFPAAAARRRICDSGGVAALVRFLESAPPAAAAAKLALAVLRRVGGAAGEDSSKKMVTGPKKMTFVAAIMTLVKKSSAVSSKNVNDVVNLPSWIRKLVDSSRDSEAVPSRKSTGKLKIPKAFLGMSK